MSRTVCWFSCGAASAVATKIALEEASVEVSVVYCDTGAEHPDNTRFLADCSKWFGVPILTLRSEKYRDTWEVFAKTRYLSGVKGARCTTELKKVLRNDYQRVDDIQVFGFDVDERERARRFQENNHEVFLKTPLINHGITKRECFERLAKAGIELPVMYRLGYKNNNCIGCVKGQMGYWNKIRRDFPDVFDRMSRVEQELNVALCKTYAGDGKRKRVFLKDLPPDAGKYEAEPSIGCGVLCDTEMAIT